MRTLTTRAAFLVVAAWSAALSVQDFTKSSQSLERRDQPVTQDDLRILERADAILSSAAVWNSHDTRKCKPDDRTWSLFCAMEKALLDVLREYRHQEVALQEVRFAVEDATKGIEFEHRMMDYNNLQSTRSRTSRRFFRSPSGASATGLRPRSRKTDQARRLRASAR